MKSYVNNLCARSAKVETYKSVLSGQPHLPKVETVKNLLFQDNHTCTHSWPGDLTYKLLTTTNLIIYANGAGITMAAGTRLTLKPLTGGVTNYVSWQGGQHWLPGKECLHSFQAGGISRWSHQLCFLPGYCCVPEK